jgi:hypothetical protein
LGTRPVPPRPEATENVLMCDRENNELEKAIVEFLRKAEDSKRDMPKPERREKPADRRIP